MNPCHTLHTCSHYTPCPRFYLSYDSYHYNDQNQCIKYYFFFRCPSSLSASILVQQSKLGKAPAYSEKKSLLCYFHLSNYLDGCRDEIFSHCHYFLIESLSPIKAFQPAAADKNFCTERYFMRRFCGSFLCGNVLQARERDRRKKKNF